MNSIIAAVTSASCPGTGTRRLSRAAARGPKLEKLCERNTFATENIPLADLSAFHGEDQARCDVAHVDEIQNEIEIKLKTLAEKTPDHRRWRCKVVVMRSDRHCWAADNHRKAGCGAFHRQSLGEQFRPCIGTRHVVRGQQDIFDVGLSRWRGTKQNGLG